MMQPSSRNKRLPSVTRRASGDERHSGQHRQQAASEIGAQHQAQRDVQQMTFDAASVAVSSTTARLE